MKQNASTSSDSAPPSYKLSVTPATSNTEVNKSSSAEKYERWLTPTDEKRWSLGSLGLGFDSHFIETVYDEDDEEEEVEKKKNKKKVDETKGPMDVEKGESSALVVKKDKVKKPAAKRNGSQKQRPFVPYNDFEIQSFQNIALSQRFAIVGMVFMCIFVALFLLIGPINVDQSYDAERTYHNNINAELKQMFSAALVKHKEMEGKVDMLAEIAKLVQRGKCGEPIEQQETTTTTTTTTTPEPVKPEYHTRPYGQTNSVTHSTEEWYNQERKIYNDYN